MLEQFFQDLTARSAPARFIQTNLHIHTPATAWDWDKFQGQTTLASLLDPQAFFQALSRTSLELVAITDHNTVAWCTDLLRVANDARSSGLSRLHILPGVEITTYEGPHLVAIFSEATPTDAIRDMLVRLGLSGEGREDEKVGAYSASPKTIFDILAEIEALNGIAIAPHVDNKDGVWGNKEFKGRSDVLNDQRLRILAAPSGDIKRVPEADGRVRLLY